MTYEVPADIKNANDLKSKLAHLFNIRRSFSVFRIDCGGCNGCEIEIFSAITPEYDPERFGFKLVANPRHADILLVSGPVTRQMYYPLLRAYEAAPDPKIVVGIGACGNSGGIFHDSYAVWGGADKIVPIDVFVPGCPPHPIAIVYGLACGLGLVEQKLALQEGSGDVNMPQIYEASVVGNSGFERDALVYAKELMGYKMGRELFAKFLGALKSSSNPTSAVSAKIAVESLVNSEEDPRYAECYKRLFNKSYLAYVNSDESKFAL